MDESPQNSPPPSSRPSGNAVPFARTRSRALAWARNPFVRLVRHFLDRLLRGGHESESDEFEFGAGPLLGVLASPGAIFSFLLFQKYSSLRDFILGHYARRDIYVTSAPDKYFFICLAMGAAGILTAIKWDRILPDSQDYLNLAPLPLKPRAIFLANAVAVAVAVGAVAVDVNLFSSFLFPLVVASYGSLGFFDIARFIFSHAFSLMLANLFMFFVILAALGTMVAVLPRGVFRACSSWARGAILIGSLVLLAAGPNAPRDPATWGRFYPPLWFLSLYQWMEGHVASAMEPLAYFALEAFAVAFVWMIAAYALGYRRSFAAVLESGKPPRKQPVARAALAFFDLFSLRASAFERACHRFILRAMLRSEAHRMCLAVAVGLGCLFGFHQATSPFRASRLEAPFMATYLLILGLRIAFEMPASLAANWQFRATLNPNALPALNAPRRVILSFLTPFVLLPAFLFAFREFGFFGAAMHVLVVTALALTLGEIMLAGYRKIPLTCPMPPFGANFLALIVLQIVAFGMFTVLGGSLDSWVLENPLRFAAIPVGMFAAALWNRRRLAQAREDGELEEKLVFENAAPVVVTRLDLFDGS